MHTQSSQCLSCTLAQIKDYPDGDAGKILDYYLRESLKNSILSFLIYKISIIMVSPLYEFYDPMTENV